MSEDMKITPSSGNVFADIGFSPQKAAKLLRASDLKCAYSVGRREAAKEIARKAERLARDCGAKGDASAMAMRIAGFARRLP